jgi:hypothetical protein
MATQTKQPQLLKYIFEVHYKDGTTYKSTQQDVSQLHEYGSCFTDVKIEEVEVFFLFNNDHCYSVNLNDGHFEVDKVPFIMHKPHKKVKNGKETIIELKDFKLHYERDVTRSQVARIKIGEDGKPIVEAMVGEEQVTIAYNFGWTCVVDGKKYQEIMQIY